MSNFAERLREERKRLGLTQADFARLGGVKITAQNNYEAGERSPKAEYLLRLVDCGVDISYLLAGRPASDGLSPEEQRLVELFRTLDDQSRSVMIASMQGAAQAVGATRPALALVATNDAPDPPPSTIDGDTLVEALTLIDLWLKKNRRTLATEGKADAVRLIYEILLDDSDDNQDSAAERIDRALRLVVG